MDISPSNRPTGRQLVWLGVAATVLIGAVAAAGMSWAARHTSAVAAAQGRVDGLFPDSTVRPPLVPSVHPAADAAAAAYLLHPADLGADWWDAQKPNPVKLEPPAGAVRAARTMLTQQHRVSGQWQVDQLILESETGFRTAEGARRYALDVERQPPLPGASPPARTSRTLDGVQVWETFSKSGRTDRFVMGDTAFSVSTAETMTDRATADRILTRAITRATNGK